MAPETDEDFIVAEHQAERTPPHPLCRVLRELRQASGLSLAQFEQRHGIAAVVVGAYERGDRVPPLNKLTAILACYGYTLQAVRVTETAVRRPVDIATELRAIADHIQDTCDAPTALV